MSSKELVEKYGYLSAIEHEDRTFIAGVKRVHGSDPEVSVNHDDSGTLWLVFCLDPPSPIGSSISRHCIPFSPSPEFHLGKAKLAIYAVGKEHIRLEVRVPEKRYFGDKPDQELEMVYGLQVKVADCYYYELADEPQEKPSA